MSGAKFKTAVLGATGYAGFELTRLMLRHSKLAPPLLLSRESGSHGALEDFYPQLTGEHLPMEPFSLQLLKSHGVEVLFLATPHELSRELVPQVLEQGIRVIDLSGAWRLKCAANRAVYGFSDVDAAVAAKFDAEAVYGLPELHRDEIRSARLVANPGCYATSIIVALAPLARAGVIDTAHGVVVDAKSGVSGAGKKPTLKTHFVEAADNLSAYSVFGHRHTGEILEQTGLRGEDVIFTPHLLPIPRGILSTIYLRLSERSTPADIEKILREFYAGAAWVRVFSAGVLPQIQHSVHTNYCDVGFALAEDGKRLILVSCLDNLLKGAAGQALQNLNVMQGWNEREGLN
ncbi:MAG TPA: N-acetyl-gamma-glutamyl-phosphate reductase [Candidatus Acidoferrales bacterium]|nr:N-acetyl-gamma-glutamyl-phosphate reductase [Candidatus Acidoferrales bacterium]